MRGFAHNVAANVIAGGILLAAAAAYQHFFSGRLWLVLLVLGGAIAGWGVWLHVHVPSSPPDDPRQAAVQEPEDDAAAMIEHKSVPPRIAGRPDSAGLPGHGVSAETRAVVEQLARMVRVMEIQATLPTHLSDDTYFEELPKVGERVRKASDAIRDVLKERCGFDVATLYESDRGLDARYEGSDQPGSEDDLKRFIHRRALRIEEITSEIRHGAIAVTPPSAPETEAPSIHNPADDLYPGIRFLLDSKAVIGVRNSGPTIEDARINVLAPKRRERQWLARIDRNRGPMPNLTDEIDHELTSGCPRSLRWSETGLKLHGFSTTEWDFFIPRFAGDPVELRIGADVIEGWRKWTFVIPEETQDAGQDRRAVDAEQPAPRVGRQAADLLVLEADALAYRDAQTKEQAELKRQYEQQQEAIGAEGGSSDSRVLVRYTTQPDSEITVRFAFPRGDTARGANARGQIELTIGHLSEVLWDIDFVSRLSTAFTARYTILFPTLLISALKPVYAMQFAATQVPDRLVSDVGDSTRLTGTVELRPNSATTLHFRIWVGYGREIPVKITLAADEIGHFEYVAPIYVVNEPIRGA